MPEFDIQLRSTPHEALQFLIGLARDDDFRAKVARNPVAALSAHNFHLVPRGFEGDEVTAHSTQWESAAERMASFEDWEAACEDRRLALEEDGFKHQGFLPPKHVVEQAIANIPHANEYGAPDGEFPGIDPFGFFLLCPLLST